MRRRLIGLLTVYLLLCGGALHASVTLESFTFANTGEEQRFKDLIEELRCLVCQNQSLIDSDAELAHDLRAEVYGMMQAGDSDAQIVDFLVARYGDFVLYEPPVKPSTYIIWYGPFVLLALGIFMLFRTLKQRRRLREPEFSTEEQQRLKQLLGDAANEEEDRQ